jgi:hypothetical protein
MINILIFFSRLIFKLTLFYILPLSKLTDVFFFFLQTVFTLKKLFISNYYSEYRLNKIFVNLQNDQNKKYVLENITIILSILYLFINCLLFFIFLFFNIFFLDTIFYKSFLFLTIITSIVNYFISVRAFFFKSNKIQTIKNYFLIITNSLLLGFLIYLKNFDEIRIINSLLLLSLFINSLFFILLPLPKFFLIKKILNFKIFKDYRFIYFINNFFKSALVSNIFNLNFLIFLISLTYKVGLIAFSYIIFSLLISQINFLSKRINNFFDFIIDRAIDDDVQNTLKKNFFIFIILLSFFLMFLFMIVVDFINLYHFKLSLFFNSDYVLDILFLLKIFSYCIPPIFIINFFLLLFYTGNFSKRIKFFFLIAFYSIALNILINCILYFSYKSFLTPYVLPFVLWVSAILFCLYSFRNYLFIFDKFYFLRIFSLIILMFFIYTLTLELNFWPQLIFSLFKIIFIYLVFYYQVNKIYRKNKLLMKNKRN